MDGAVLGLGRMGRAAAERLIGAGHQITVWNRTSGRAGDLIALGAVEAATPAEAVTGAEFVLVSLTGDDAVRQVLLPDGKPLPGLDGVVIDCSTVAPQTSRDEAEGYPGSFLACPIAGAPTALAAGTALLIVAGEPQALERAAPALDALSPSRRDAGADPRTAAVIKLLNNYLLLGGLALLADAVALAQASGFDDQDELSALLAALPTVAPALTNRIGGLVSRDHDPAFTVDLAAKDLALVADLAEQAGTRLGMSETVQGRYSEAVELGVGGRDLTAVIETLRRDAGAAGEEGNR